jgi:hypothetical protein
MKVGFEPSNLCSGNTDIASLNSYLDDGNDVNLNVVIKDHELTEEYDDRREHNGSLLHCAILFNQTKIVKLLLVIFHSILSARKKRIIQIVQ